MKTPSRGGAASSAAAFAPASAAAAKIVANRALGLMVFLLARRG
jgi:hypothetical protein